MPQLSEVEQRDFVVEMLSLWIKMAIIWVVMLVSSKNK